MSYPPKVGTSGALHHERESFRSGWPKAREFLAQRVYRGEIPDKDAGLLQTWYAIRQELLEGHDQKLFDKKRGEFFKSMPENNDDLDNAISLITGFLNNSV